MKQTVQIQVEQAASRLDRFLTDALPEFSRSQIQKLIRQGRVTLSQQIARPGMSLRPGDIITLNLPSPPPDKPQPQQIPLDIIFEDDNLIVINKPAGMVVHPGPGHSQGTLVNALLARYPELISSESDAPRRPGIVHRLDRDTSGLIVVARTAPARRHLQRQFKDRRVEKTYLALADGQLPAPAGLIDVPLGRDPRHRQRFAARSDGKPARTRYRLVEAWGRFSLLEIGLETGRTHQIRVHLAWLDCPVVGDTVYGHRQNPLGLSRQFLHAWRLGFSHPRTGQSIHFEASLPDDLQAVLAHLRA